MTERVDDLLARMTLDERVAQLTGILPFDLLGAGGLDEQRFDEHLSEGLGEISAGALECRSLTVDREEVDASGTLEVRVETANTGDRFGEEEVQLHARLRRRASSVRCASSFAAVTAVWAPAG